MSCPRLKRNKWGQSESALVSWTLQDRDNNHQKRVPGMTLD